MSTLSIATIKSQNTLPPAVQNSSGTEIGTFCRAWVNFNGTGTVAIRASFNVSSITDNGAGNYTVNFTNAMPDENYAVGGSSKITNSSGGSGPANEPLTIGPYNFATGSISIYTTYDSTLNDAQIVAVDIHR